MRGSLSLHPLPSAPGPDAAEPGAARECMREREAELPWVSLPPTAGSPQGRGTRIGCAAGRSCPRPACLTGWCHSSSRCHRCGPPRTGWPPPRRRPRPAAPAPALYAESAALVVRHGHRGHARRHVPGVETRHARGLPGGRVTPTRSGVMGTRSTRGQPSSGSARVPLKSLRSPCWHAACL